MMMMMMMTFPLLCCLVGVVCGVFRLLWEETMET